METALQLIRDQPLVALVSPRSLDVLFLMPPRLGTHVTIISSSLSRSSYLQEQQTNSLVTYLPAEKFAPAPYIFLDLYLPPSEAMLALMSSLQQSHLTFKLVLCGPSSSILSTAWPHASLYEFDYPAVTRDVRFPSLGNQTVASYLTYLLPRLEGPVMVVAPNEKVEATLREELGNLASTLSYDLYVTALDKADLMTIPDLAAVIAPVVGEDYVRVFTHLLLSEKSVAYFLGPSLPDGAKESLARGALYVAQWNSTQNDPELKLEYVISEELQRELHKLGLLLQGDMLTDLGKQVLLYPDLPMRGAICYIKAQTPEEKNAILVLYGLMSVDMLFQFRSRPTEERLIYDRSAYQEEQVAFFRKLYEDKTDVDVLVRIWNDWVQHRASRTLEAWCEERHLSLRAFRSVLSFISKYQDPNNISVINVPEALLREVHQDRQVSQVSLPSLYSDGSELYQYQTYGKVSQLAQDPPPVLIALKTEPRKLNFSNDLLLHIAM